jgi:hypothetical protein
LFEILFIWLCIPLWMGSLRWWILHWSNRVAFLPYRTLQ